VPASRRCTAAHILYKFLQITCNLKALYAGQHFALLLMLARHHPQAVTGIGTTSNAELHKVKLGS